MYLFKEMSHEAENRLKQQRIKNSFFEVFGDCTHFSGQGLCEQYLVRVRTPGENYIKERMR